MCFVLFVLFYFATNFNLDTVKTMRLLFTSLFSKFAYGDSLLCHGFAFDLLLAYWVVLDSYLIMTNLFLFLALKIIYFNNNAVPSSSSTAIFHSIGP